MRVLTIISGVLLVLTGVFCFANPGETFLSLAFVLGLIMVLSSIIQGIAYMWGRSGKDDNNGWILTEAIITCVLGVLVLSYQIAADVAIPMVFGMWVMFSGILRVVTATMIDRTNKKLNFAWTLITGLLCAVGGLYAFLNPIIAGLAIAVLLGIMFVLQGISTLELGIHMPHEKKEKKPKHHKKEKKHKKEKVVSEQQTAEFPPVTAQPEASAGDGEAGSQAAGADPSTESVPSAGNSQSAKTETTADQSNESPSEDPIAAALRKAEEDQIAAAMRKAEKDQIAAAIQKPESGSAKGTEAQQSRNADALKAEAEQALAKAQAVMAAQRKKQAESDKPDFSNIFKD